MHKPLPFLFIPALVPFLLSGCGSSSTVACDCPAAPQPTVSMTMTDDPPAGVSVLFFQVSLTAATLTPTTGSTVSLIGNNPNPTPIQIDVTQLQTLSAFLGTASAPAATYTALNLTFANPQLVIYNQSDASLGSSCAVGAICTLTPTFDNSSSSLTFTSSPLPVTTSTSSPLSFLIDFHLNTVIQPDLSVNLNATNGVTVSELPAATPKFGFLVGTVANVSPTTDNFTLQFPWGPSPSLAVSSSTTYNNFPASACATPSIACLAQGQIVRVQISGVGGNNYLPLTVSQVTYVQQAGAQTVEGTIVAIPPLPLPAGETLLKVLLHQNPTASTSLPLGGLASIAVWAPGSGSNTPTTFSIDNNGFTIPAGYTFATSNDLTVGQTIQVTVTPGSVTNTGAGPASGVWGTPASVSFTASAIELEPSQVTGTITAVDSGTTSFSLGAAGAPFFAPWPLPNATGFSFNVVATGQTTYAGFNPDSFSGLATNDFVSVNGWLFPPATTGPPNIVAQSVLMRPGPTF